MGTNNAINSTAPAIPTNIRVVECIFFCADFIICVFLKSCSLFRKQLSKFLKKVILLRCFIPGSVAQRCVASGRRNPYVTLHFLVQCTTEIGTVHRYNTYFCRNPFQCSCFSRQDKKLGIVVTHYSKSVW